MYELNGKTWTVDDIQSAADRNNLSYDDALEQLTGAGMKEVDNDDSMLKDFWDSFVNKYTEIEKSSIEFDALIANKISFFGGEEAGNAYLDFSNWIHGGDDSKDLGQIALVDPETGLKVAFDHDAYDRDGHDAIENKRYYELVKLKKNQARGYSGFDAVRVVYDKTGQSVEDVFNQKMNRQFELSDKKASELRQITNVENITFTEAVKEGNIRDATLKSFDFIAGTLKSVAMAKMTFGFSMLAEMQGMSFKTYNDEKSKALFGENDPDRIKKLFESEKEEYVVPAVLGQIGYLFEKIGYKGISKEIAKKSMNATGKKILSMIGTGKKEGLTEYAQGLVEKLNESLGKQKTIEQASADVADFMFSPEALDNYFAGLIGGGGLSSSQMAVDAALRADQTSNQFINTKIASINDLQEAYQRTSKKSKRKEIQDLIDINVADLKYYLKRNNKTKEYLTTSQQSNLISLLDDKKGLYKEASDVNSLYRKGLMTQSEYDNAIKAVKEKSTKIDENITKIKNDANMSLLMQDLDASGKLVKEIKNLEQNVYKTEAEFLEALKAEYLAKGKTEKQFEDDTNGVKIDGLKIGNKLLINAEVAAEKNAFATGTHEILHGILKSTLQSEDGTGNLSSQGVKIVNSFLESISSKERNYLEKKLKEGGYKVNNDGTTKEFKEYGEEYLNFYAQGSKEGAFSLNAVEKAGRWISSFFRANSDFKKIGFEDGQQVKNFLNAVVSDSKQGIYRKEFVELAKKGAQMKDETVDFARAYKKTDRDVRIDKLGEQYTKEEYGSAKDNKPGKGTDVYFELYASGDLEAMVRSRITDEMKRTPGFLEEDFVNETIIQLKKHIENFDVSKKKTEEGFGLSGWIRSQVGNKIGDVLKKGVVTEEKFTSDIQESTEAQVVAAEEADLEVFEMENLSPGAQLARNKEKQERQSKLRRKLGFETGGEMYNKVLNSAKKSVLIAYKKTQSIKDPAERAKAIKDLLRKEYFTSGLTSDLFKSTKNFLGKKDYIKNLKQYREAIIESLSTADLVQMERNIPDTDRVFTFFVEKLTKIEDVESAVRNGLLPTEAINAIRKGQAVNLYRKRMPTEMELVSFADQPAINPTTGQRSGLKGTRKDGFAKAIANTMVLDAVMEVRQSEDVVEALEDDAIAQLDLMALSDAVGREVDVKFSKSTAVVDINNAIDNNINLAVYSQIKFSRSHREAYEARLTKKRTDLDEKQIKGAVESIFKFVESDNIPNNKKAKYEKMAMHYMANGYLILPEDGYKVIEAERIATIKKIDPFSYKNPNELIERFVGEVKGARTNPDTVKEFTNKTDVGSGVIVYDVADSKEGQLAVRKVIDTHFGKKANPWCLAARRGTYLYTDEAFDKAEKDAIVEREEAKGYNVVVYEMANYMEGILYEGKPGQTIEAYEIVVSEKADPKNELKESFKNWKSYNKEGNGYKIAFKDGKLLCFRDGNKKQWWDRNDKPSDKIHFVVTEKKGDVESTFTVVPEDGTKTLTKKIKGKMPNAEVFYVRDDNNYNIKSTTTYVGGAITKQRIETTYKDSRLAGTIFLEKEMGQSSDIQLNNMTKDVEVKDGDILTRELKGKVVLTSKQFKQFEDKAVEIEQVTNIQTSETISLTINGVKQDIGVKFSKSVAEVNYNKALNSIKFSRKKQDPYIADQLNIARELGNTSDEIIYARLEQELKNGTPLQEAHAVAFKEAYGDQAAEIIQQDGNSVKDLQQNINKFYLPKVRAFAKDVALKKYAKLIKATKDTEAQQDLINSFLINYGRPIRSGKVLNITTNRALLVEMEKAFGEEAMRPYELVPVESGEKVMVNGEDIDLYKSITPIKADPAKYTDKVNEQAGFAKKFLFEDVLQDDNLSNGEKKALVQLMFYGQKGPGRKLYKLGVYVEGMPVSKTTLEHEITANDMHNAIIDVIDGKMDIDELRDTIDNAYVHVLPKEINDVFKKLGKTSKRNLQGYNSMPEVLEYLQTLNLKGNTGLFDFSNNEAISRKGSAIKPSRSVNKLTKGITVLDFDDTLATSKSLVKFTRPDGTKGTLTPEQYAATYEDLLDLGYKFDFSEFSKVVDGKPAPLLNKAKKLAGKFGTENMFILTARPADSAPAIKEFLKQNGLDIPLKNITGLGNSTAEAKALWMADKVADGYNDFYFADDALKNVQAVKNVLDQFDVKSKIQQARVKFSKSLSPELNKMIERNKGFKAEQVFDEATAKQLGKDKGKYEFFISAGADDFQGLMMRLAGKGEQGNRDMQFFKETLFDPFNKAYREMNEYAYVMLNDLDALIKEYPDVRKRFKQPLEGTDFDTDQAIRIYLWHKNGQDIPGLSDKQAANISSKVASDSRLVEFATKLNKIPKLRGEYTKPGENWTVENIKADIYNAVENSRAEFLLEWQENADALFAQENLNKLEAVYGSDYVDALKNILHRMKTGRNRVAGKDKEANKLLNWINNSVGAIMFFNSRSAVLQTLSIVNFIDYENNNIFAAGKAFANQKQYWEDFSFLFNSPTLKMRRAGVQTDVSASDIAEAVKGKRNPAKAAIAYLLTVGFTPTQIADSFAISAGGATYYRNQVNFYVKEGMSRPKAEEKAFADFQSKTEEAQQSSRPDRISRQQASVLGRLILAFQNTPMQYNRIIKKSVLDIVNGRGDLKSNISKILYYGTAQGLIFNALQNAIFALNFDDDEEEMTDKELKKAQKFKEKKYNRILDGMISSLLRGSGLKGAYIDTVYKTVKEFQTQRAKGWKADHAETFITALNVSPPIGSKFRKLYSAIKSDKFNKDIYDHMSYGDINHPIYDVATSAIEAVTNAPTQRMHRKIININDAFRDHLSVWQRAFLLGGWNRWSLGIEEGEEKKEAIEAAKQEKKETIKKRKPKKDEKRCSAIKSDGKRCKNITTNESGRCYAHD